MDRIVLYPAQYARGDIAGDIATCTAILQEAASFVFSLPELRAGTFFIPAVETQPGYRVFNPPDHRVIVGEPATLRLERPYMVAFYGIRTPDPDGLISEDLLGVDNRLIGSLVAFGVGLYNTASWQGEYKNTAVLPDAAASQRWAEENSLHQAAVQNLAPRSYQKILKFTGYVDGWPWDCRVAVDEVVLLQG